MIPKQFELFGQTIKVEFTDGLVANGGNDGESVYWENLIRLQPNTEEHRRSPDFVEHVFYHELAHWVLFFAGQYYENGKHLHEDEKLVDLIGGLLHQQAKTSQY